MYILFESTDINLIEKSKEGQVHIDDFDIIIELLNKGHTVSTILAGDDIINVTI